MTLRRLIIRGVGKYGDPVDVTKPFFMELVKDDGDTEYESLTESQYVSILKTIGIQHPTVRATVTRLGRA